MTQGLRGSDSRGGQEGRVQEEVLQASGRSRMMKKDGNEKQQKLRAYVIVNEARRE